MKLFKSTILFALASVVSASNFIEVNIDKLRIIEANKSGQIGTLLFKSAIITRDSLSFNLQKKEDHSFNSSVTYINKQLSMSNDMLTAQFDMSDNEFLDDVSLLNLDSSDSSISPVFFTLDGQNFTMNKGANYIEAQNFFLFCTANDPDYDMASGTGIIKGCLTELNVSPKSFDEEMFFTYKRVLESGDDFTMNGDLKALSLTGSELINFQSDKSVMSVKEYDIDTKSLDANCKKDSDLYEVDSDQILHTCENSLDITVPKVLVKNDKEKTRFYFDVKKLNVASEKLIFKSDVFQFLDKMKTVTTTGLEVDCQKTEDSSLFDLPTMIDQCLENGDIVISNIKTLDEAIVKRTSRRQRRDNRRQRIKAPSKTIIYSARYDESELDDYKPLDKITLDKSDLSNIDISIRNGRAIVKAKAYKNILLKKNFNIDMVATASFDRKKSQLILDVESVEVPFGFFKIKWIWLIEKIIKKAIVGGAVKYNDGKFVIEI